MRYKESSTMRFLRNQRSLKNEPRGVVAVEFAIIAPVLVAVVVGLISMSRAYEAQNLLETAAREGARFAAMDRTGMLLNGQTANQKIASDVKNYLACNGIDRDHISVAVTHYPDTDTTFNLDDPLNDLKLFQVRVGVDYGNISHGSVSAGDDFSMVSKIVFRNGRAILAD